MKSFEAPIRIKDDSEKLSPEKVKETIEIYNKAIKSNLDFLTRGLEDGEKNTHEPWLIDEVRKSSQFNFGIF